MGYTITFYAIDAQAFARQLRESSEELLEKIAKAFQQEAAQDDCAAEILIDAARRICRDEIPEHDGLEYVHALCWLAEVTSERVTICSFQDFRHLSFLDEIGIWPWMLQRPPPFPAPRSEDCGAELGYLPVEDMESFAFPEFARLPASTDRDVINARDEFRDVLETLVPDRLDLLAVLHEC